MTDHANAAKATAKHLITLQNIQRTALELQEEHGLQECAVTCQTHMLCIAEQHSSKGANDWLETETQLGKDREPTEMGDGLLMERVIREIAKFFAHTPKSWPFGHGCERFQDWLDKNYPAFKFVGLLRCYGQSP